ncbi:MAG: zinc ribbon domain-containing protein [Lentisphaerae bacterium]|nr:zinc ribbon domain-containing protein [Lentisphaerota bacterium]
MPIYEYEARNPARSCAHCANGFETLQKMAAAPLSRCPRCGAPVRRRVSAPSVGVSRSGFDARARDTGFHKLQRLGKGEYEKQY